MSTTGFPVHKRSMARHDMGKIDDNNAFTISRRATRLNHKYRTHSSSTTTIPPSPLLMQNYTFNGYAYTTNVRQSGAARRGLMYHPPFLVLPPIDPGAVVLQNGVPRITVPINASLRMDGTFNALPWVHRYGVAGYRPHLGFAPAEGPAGYAQHAAVYPQFVNGAGLGPAGYPPPPMGIAGLRGAGMPQVALANAYAGGRPIFQPQPQRNVGGPAPGPSRVVDKGKKRAREDEDGEEDVHTAAGKRAKARTHDAQDAVHNSESEDDEDEGIGALQLLQNHKGLYVCPWDEYRCPDQYRTKDKCELAAHIQKAHMVAYPYKCPLCPDYVGEKQWHLSAHIRTKHQVGDVDENIPGGGQ
ncbi:hypothetical protein C8Q74DRAFT_213889 [Fomes fomentarius]|nr:hypothetical protein C8Q74DRAFT_213889 [Fomes fomentarius]